LTNAIRIAHGATGGLMAKFLAGTTIAQVIFDVAIESDEEDTAEGVHVFRTVTRTGEGGELRAEFRFPLDIVAMWDNGLGVAHHLRQFVSKCAARDIDRLVEIMAEVGAKFSTDFDDGLQKTGERWEIAGEVRDENLPGCAPAPRNPPAFADDGIDLEEGGG
jgi:hypothetical protein